MASNGSTTTTSSVDEGPSTPLLLPVDLVELFATLTLVNRRHCVLILTQLPYSAYALSCSLLKEAIIETNSKDEEDNVGEEGDE
jgi:hypothetical protein